MVPAALPESCWYTMLLARLSNVPLEGWGTNPVPPTRVITSPRGRSRSASSRQAVAQSIARTPWSAKRQGIMSGTGES